MIITRKGSVFFALAILASPSQSGSAATFRPPVPTTIQPIVGLNTHERQDPKEIKTLTDTGALYRRWHYSWKEVEKSRGVYELPAAAYDCMRLYQAAGNELVYILAYDNPLYNTQARKKAFGQYIDEPQEWIKAYGNYCAWAARTFGSRGTGQVKYFEVWNEQNAGSVTQYMALLREASTRIRAEDPEALILFGGVSRADIGFIRECLEQGAVALVDAINWHPYREETFPEDGYHSKRYGFEKDLPSYADEVMEIRKLVEKHAAEAGKKIELWVTEMGTFGDETQPGHPENIKINTAIQAKYLLRSHIQNFALGVRAVMWYRATDSAFFGLTWGGDSFYPTPSYHALTNFLRYFPQKQNVTVLGWNPTVRPELPDAHVYAFQTDPTTVLLFTWDASKTDRLLEPRVRLNSKHYIDIPANCVPGEVEAIDLLSNTSLKLKVVSNGENSSRIISVPINDSPLMIRLRLASSTDPASL